MLYDHPLTRHHPIVEPLSKTQLAPAWSFVGHFYQHTSRLITQKTCILTQNAPLGQVQGVLIRYFFVMHTTRFGGR